MAGGWKESVNKRRRDALTTFVGAFVFFDSKNPQTRWFRQYGYCVILWSSEFNEETRLRFVFHLDLIKASKTACSAWSGERYGPDMFKELDVIALTAEVPLDHIWDVPDTSPLIEKRNPGDGLKVGDVGTIVCIQGNGEALEVEFLGPDGNTMAIATISPSQARLATEEDLTKRSLLKEVGSPALSRPHERMGKKEPL